MPVTDCCYGRAEGIGEGAFPGDGIPILEAIEEAEVAQLIRPTAAGREAVCEFSHALVRAGGPMLAAMEQLGGFVHHGHVHLATALYYAGSWDEARRHNEAAIQGARDGWFGWCGACHLELLAILGERDLAVEMLDTHAEARLRSTSLRYRPS